MAISSTDCRARVRSGQPVWYLVPDGVVPGRVTPTKCARSQMSSAPCQERISLRTSAPVMKNRSESGSG
jgi:hypothetical protein